MPREAKGTRAAALINRPALKGGTPQRLGPQSCWRFETHRTLLGTSLEPLKSAKFQFCELLAASGSFWERLGAPRIDSECPETNSSLDRHQGMPQLASKLVPSDFCEYYIIRQPTFGGAMGVSDR